ncbi:hypothetical protein CsSME_00021261 [Camellia sinensis var. sinensis]
MGVVTITEEYALPIPPARAFKALILDGDNLIPKLLPQAFKSIVVIQGDGGAGSIKYTLIEGDLLMGKFEKICYEMELVPTLDGGSISKSTSKYYPLGDLVLNEEEIKAGMDKAGGMFKVVEDYLIQNPDAYA